MKMKFALVTILFLLTVSAISPAAEKTITAYKGDRNVNVITPHNTVQFDNNISTNFTAGASTAGAVTLNATNYTATLGGVANACGVLWYKGTYDGTTNKVANCTSGICDFGTGFRAYFEFTATADTSANSSTYGDGFTFTVMNGDISRGNTTASIGGPPSGVTNFGELMCYAGSGSLGNGLVSPKFGIEYDMSANTGAQSSGGCNKGRADGTYNHNALVLWGAATAGTCAFGTTAGCCPAQLTYDDNIHGAGTAGSTTVPQNPLNTDTTGGYCQRLAGKVGSYNWMEDGQKHRVRIEVKRATTAATLGCAANTYAYTIKEWLDCEGGSTCCTSAGSCTSCPVSEYANFKDLLNDYTNSSYLPKINRTVCLSSTLHGYFNTMLYGFTIGTGTNIQTITLSNFAIYFLEPACTLVPNPIIQDYNSTTATSTLTWTIINGPAQTGTWSGNPAAPGGTCGTGFSNSSGGSCTTATQAAGANAYTLTVSDPAGGSNTCTGTAYVGCANYQVWNGLGATHDFKIGTGTCINGITNGSRITTALPPGGTLYSYASAGTCSTLQTPVLTYDNARDVDIVANGGNGNCQVNFTGNGTATDH